jgi:hypothetical protein
VTDFSAALRAAALRVPGSVAERSLAQAAPYRLMADYHDVPLPELTVRAGPVRIGHGESWCLRCGETFNSTGYCLRCGSQRCITATSVLQPDEYYIAS